MPESIALQNLIIPITAIVIAIAILVWSADRFVYGAAGTAKHLKVSPLIIGLVIMGFGTSAPEMMVSSLAALEGSPSIGIGNAIGSNIANIALVLGFTALIMPITVRSEILRREFPLLLAITAATGIILMDYSLDRVDGAILLTSLIVLLFWLIQSGKSNNNSESQDSLSTEVSAELIEEIPQNLPIGWAIFWTITGFAFLLISSKVIVSSAVEIAEIFKVSELIIGLTIIAIGTSLPELAASITAARKNEHDMAIGNIIGSNLFNILGVLALPGLIAPSIIEESVLNRDFTVMLSLTVLLYLMATIFKSDSKSIGRIEGAILLTCFVSYLWLLFTNS